MASKSEPRELRKQREQLKAELAGIGDLRAGSLVGRYRKCGKPNCRCAGEGAPGHGPSWSLTRKVGGKTVTKIIPAAAVPQTQEQIAEYRRFRKITRELVEVSDQLCDAQLEGPEASSQEAKKGASSRRSRPRSSRKSKRS